MKICLFCAEEIQDAAIVCRHCKRDLSAPPRRSRKPIVWWSLVALVAMVGFWGWSLNGQAGDVVDGFIDAGLFRSFSCDRASPRVVVGPRWDSIPPKAQRGAVNALKMVCSTTEMAVVRE